MTFVETIVGFFAEIYHYIHVWRERKRMSTLAGTAFTKVLPGDETAKADSTTFKEIHKDISVDD